MDYPAGSNRRSGNDRREKSCFTIRYILGIGRRVAVRRKEDRKRILYVDNYSPKLFIAIAVILFLSAIDAFLTLYLVGYGAYEINPMMAYFLNAGPYTFFALKYGLTSVSAVVLLLLRNNVLRWVNVSAHSLLYFFAGAFIATVVWEFYLLSQVGI